MCLHFPGPGECQMEDISVWAIPDDFCEDPKGTAKNPHECNTFFFLANTFRSRWVSSRNDAIYKKIFYNQRFRKLVSITLTTTDI